MDLDNKNGQITLIISEILLMD